MNNFNLAGSTNYRLEFPDAPALSYFSQTAQLPGVTAVGVETPFRGALAYMQADRIDYDPLSIQFLVDEEFENYLYLYNWMKRDTTKETPPSNQRDATLHILTGNKTSNLRVFFYGLFPQMLGSIDFESAVTDTSPLICNCTFRYNYFTIERA